MKAPVEESIGPEVEMSPKRQFRFEKLNVWQSARRLAGEVYAVTKAFPKDELFGFSSQLRRASVSVASNIAEGSGRNSDPDFARFLEMAYASAMEVASLLFLAGDTGLLPLAARDRLLEMTSGVTAQMNALNQSLEVEHSKTPFTRRSSS